MSKAYRKWKEMRKCGLLHRGPKPKRIFTMRNYRMWKRVKARWHDENTKKHVLKLKALNNIGMK